MRRIHKFGPFIPSQDIFDFNADPGYFGVQNGQLFVWGVVTDGDKDYPLEYQIVGTGQEYEDTWQLVTSVVTNQGFVWHLLGRVKNKS